MPRNGIDGVLRTLAGMPGARTETHESVRFDVGTIRDVMDQIRRLQGTGSLTINFANGKPNGLAKWEEKPRGPAS